jgi:hypothetical protein
MGAQFSVGTHSMEDCKAWMKTHGWDQMGEHSRIA